MRVSLLFVLRLLAVLAVFSGIAISAYADAPNNFRQAKVMLKDQVYFDRNTVGDSYCGCTWQWVGESGGRTDLASCGYQVRSEGNRNRAERTEIEHLIPAHSMGQARQCWWRGGRKNCNKTDPVFNAMESNLFNLTVVVGEVNADRSNIPPGMVAGAPSEYGACKVQIDFKSRRFEPPPHQRGMIARTYFYVYDHYDLQMSRGQSQLLMAWDKQYPVSEWERVRHDRIANIMQHTNPFVTGESQWSVNHKNSGAGAVTFVPLTSRPSAAPAAVNVATANSGKVIRGNRNSQIYHLPQNCPSYNRISPKNIVEFQTEQAAVNAGFRIAGNCR